jgi:hypothetical protein
MLQIAEWSAIIWAEVMTMDREHHRLTHTNAQVQRKETQ